MNEIPLKARLTEAMKDAMRSKDKARLGAIRLILAEIKRIEVDERIEVEDQRILVILDKMTKQRKDSESQYRDAGREELAAVERAEIEVIAEFLPEALSTDEIDALISSAISETGATSMKDMGKIMAILKPQLQGRADMGSISQEIKNRLS